MPTGYTADIAKGIMFKQFAMNCARAFGALVLMRDDPADAPIPEKFEPSDYHVKALAEARAELARLESMGEGMASVAAIKEWEANDSARRVRMAERDELRRKYNAMLAEARAWNPPTPDHVGMRDFMVEQINESIKFDCSSRYDTPEILLDGNAWLAQKRAAAMRDVEYHSQENAKEIARAAERTEWVKALRFSL